MPVVDRTGVEILSQAFFKESLEQIYRTAGGEDLDLDFESPQGQIINLDSITWADIEQACALFIKSLHIDCAEGIFLDYLGTLLNIKRRPALRTRANVTLTGTAGTLVASGTKLVSLTNGYEFETDFDAIITQVGQIGTINVAVTAVNSGPITVGVGELQSIVDFVQGLETANNAAEQSFVGNLLESDTTYRTRLRAQTAKNALGTVEALEASLRVLPLMKNALVIENATDASVTEMGLTTGARSIHVVVNGVETDHDIADVIARKKSAGIPTEGSTTVNVVRDNGTSVAIKFTDATEIPITVMANLDIFQAFDTASLDTIKETIIIYIDELILGEYIDLNRIIGAIYSVGNHRMTSLVAVKKVGGGVINTQGSINSDQVYTLTLNDITIVTNPI